MFKKRKRSKQKKNLKKKLNLDNIEDNHKPIENTIEEENKEILGKRPSPSDNQQNTLGTSSAQISTIYKNTIEKASNDIRPTSESEIKENLQKLKIAESRKKHKKGIFGPVKQLKSIQHSNGIDYNPSRCKDFHDTGYCVFGNSCIFIHDRTDYKSGYELDRDWDMLQRGKQEKKRKKLISGGGDGDSSVSSSDDEEDLEDYEDELVYKEIDPQCLLCGEDYKWPTLLTCGHIFCDKCAMAHYTNDKTCFKCGKNTNGIFNDGTKLLKKALKERVKVMESRKGKKKQSFGSLSNYLVGVKKNGENRGFGRRDVDKDEDAAVVVPEAEVEKAMVRIQLKEKVN